MNFNNKLIRRFRKFYRISIGQQFCFLQKKLLPVGHSSTEFIPLFSNLNISIPSGIEDVANKIIQGNYYFLGIEINSEPIPQWHKDYMTNYIWPLLPHNKIRKNTPKNVELKNVWELSSFFHLFPVALAYNYFKYTKYKKFIINQIIDWSRENPFSFGVNWANPMNVALRIILLIEIKFIIEIDDKDKQSIFNINNMIWDHLIFLINNIENIGECPANHLIANITGLLWGSLYFKPNNFLIKHIRNFSVRHLEIEIQRQVKQDGMHFEGSIGYHKLVTEFFLFSAVLLLKNHIKVSQNYLNKLFSMLQVLYYFTMPNNNLPQFGDNDDCRIFYAEDYFNPNKLNAGYLLTIGSALFNNSEWNNNQTEYKKFSDWIIDNNKTNIKLFSVINSKNLQSSIFLDSSKVYIFRNKGDRLFIFFNHTGKVGGGHSHNDTLSFFLCLNGTPIFIDPGTFVYTRDLTMRNLFRSTCFHNVVQIDDSEQWSLSLEKPFALPKKNAPKVIIYESNIDEDIIVGEHFGYLRLPGKLIHRRYYYFNKNNYEIKIKDFIYNNSEKKNSINVPYKLNTYFHVSNEVKIEQHKSNMIIFSRNTDGRRLCSLEFLISDNIKIYFKDSFISRGYGLIEKSKVLIFESYSFLPYRYKYKIKKITT